MVNVIDVRTGALKTMPARYAKILVKLKRARWPDEVLLGPFNVATLVDADMEAEPLDADSELDIDPSLEIQSSDPVEPKDAPKRRGRKPKNQE